MSPSRFIVALAAGVVGLGVTAGAVAYLTTAGAAAPSSGLPPALSWVPESASVVGYLDMESVSSSPLARTWSRMSRSSDGLGALEQIREKTGIDVLQDVDALTFTVAQKEGSAEPRWGIALSGAFDADALVQGLGESARATELEVHEGTSLFRLRSPADPSLPGDQSSLERPSSLFAIPDGATLLVAQSDYLREMLDAGAGRSPSAAAVVESWGYGRFDEEAFWIAGTPSEILGSMPLQGRARPEFPQLRTFAVSGRFASEVLLRARGRAADGEAAQKLVDVLRGLVALGRLQQGVSPELGELADAVRIELVEDRIDISLLVSYDTIERLMERRRAERAAP